ncbi:hypothetical protein AB595_07690 [Massilia sp. WF1]|nr:hypothetical protein AM586_20760 [Massilia sp. WG5]KLU37174.1 hypothetical protein AB595_07690 [Massilia sp. WF1]
MMAAGLCAAALQAPTQELEEHKAVQPKLSLRLSDAVIEKAVRETLAEQKGKLGTPSGKTLSGDAYQKFERAFSEAEKPDCLHPDAMKFQPHSLQFKILGQTYGMGVGGLLALPFWGAAIVRGKCN